MAGKTMTEELVEIPFQQLDPEILRALLEEFVTP